MELFGKFKKDYFNYLISIIIPAIISGISIPVFKHLLGPEGYGVFALWFNAALILTAVLSGWIAQSIIRFYPANKKHAVFSKFSINLSTQIQFVVCLPIFIIVWAIGKDWLLALLFSLTVIISSLQFTILPIIQSAFLSKKIIRSESIRISIYIGGSILLLIFTQINFIYCLFIAAILAYMSSFVYLHKQSEKYIIDESGPSINSSDLLKRFLKYGAPLSLWFVCTYLFSYIDKLFTFYVFGASVQGNYQALFDFINKSLILLISPVITSLFPLLTSAYEQKNNHEIRILMQRIFLIEFGGYLAVSILYWIFGADLLMYILKIPNISLYRWMGFIIISATFILQFAILAQKRFELKMRTAYLLLIAACTLALQGVFYWLFRNSTNELIAPIGFLLVSLLYFSVVTLPLVKLLRKKKSTLNF